MLWAVWSHLGKSGDHRYIGKDWASMTLGRVEEVPRPLPCVIKPTLELRLQIFPLEGTADPVPRSSQRGKELLWIHNSSFFRRSPFVFLGLFPHFKELAKEFTLTFYDRPLFLPGVSLSSILFRILL